MSSLKKFRQDAESILNNAIMIYRSTAAITIFVEGVNDKRFLLQSMNQDDKVRFDGFNGKELVESIFSKYRNAKNKIKENFGIFVIDLDYDKFITSNVFTSDTLIYNVFCEEENKVHYNDLEIFLINTNSFEKLLVNFDISKSLTNDYRHKLEKASREIGKYRVADILLQKKKNINNSILNGIEIKYYFDSKNIHVDDLKIKKELPKWTNYKHFIDELMDLADNLNKSNLDPWTLSRGHDVTEFIALHLNDKGHKRVNRTDIELNLRIGTENIEFFSSPMGKKLNKLRNDLKF